MYLPSLCLQCILLKKGIEGPLCPSFYGHPSSNLSAINARETYAVLAGTKMSHSDLTSLDMASRGDGNYIYMHLSHACNVVYEKKGIEGMLRPVFYLPVRAGGSRSHDQHPPCNIPRKTWIPGSNVPGIMAFLAG